MVQDSPAGPSSRRPLLTPREQAVIAFLLALLILGGIVLKLRTEWPEKQPASLSQP